MRSYLRPAAALLVVTLFLSSAYISLRGGPASLTPGLQNGEPAEIIYVLAKDGIPAILNPDFEGGEWILDSDRVVGVALNGEARAYPLRILNWHEIVDDEVGGVPVAVTYCPLCGTGIVFDRNVSGETLTFGVSGKLYRNDLVMYDHQTDSLWSQVLGEALQGPRQGQQLEQVQAWTLSWGAWKERYPDSLLLQRPTDNSGNYQRDYDRDPYAGYEQNRETLFGVENVNASLHPKAWVAGVDLGGQQRAYTYSLLQNQRLVNDVVGGQPLVVAWSQGAASAYHRGEAEFAVHNETHMRDLTASSGALYEMATGKRADGTLAEGLEPLPLVTGFWFGWYDFYPETTIYDGAAAADSDNVPEVQSQPGFGGVAVGAGAVIAALVLGRRRRRR